jgi:hypothetical protein
MSSMRERNVIKLWNYREDRKQIYVGMSRSHLYSTYQFFFKYFPINVSVLKNPKSSIRIIQDIV